MSRWPKTEKAVFASEVALLLLGLCVAALGVYAAINPEDAQDALGYDARPVATLMMFITIVGLAGVEYVKWYIKNHD